MSRRPFHGRGGYGRFSALAARVPGWGAARLGLLVAGAVLITAADFACAHPMDTPDYGIRTTVYLVDDELRIRVVLAVPLPAAMPIRSP